MLLEIFLMKDFLFVLLGGQLSTPIIFFNPFFLYVYKIRVVGV